MAIFGYGRVSGVNQNEDRQMLAMSMLNIPLERIFTDKQSGKDFNRPAYKSLMDELQSGDLLYIKSIDRLGRNYEEIQNQRRILTEERRVDIAVIDMPLLDTRNGRDLVGIFLADIVLQILFFVAQNERENIRKRQDEGIKAARIRGIHLGRPLKKPPDNFLELANLWLHRNLTTTELMRKTGLTETTLYRRLREHQVVRIWFEERGKNIHVAFCPERILEGKAMTELNSLP